MVVITVNVDEVRERLKKGEDVPSEFISWLNKHPDVTGEHRFCIVKGKSGFFFQLRDPYPPSERQLEVRTNFASIQSSLNKAGLTRWQRREATAKILRGKDDKNG